MTGLLSALISRVYGICCYLGANCRHSSAIQQLFKFLFAIMFLLSMYDIYPDITLKKFSSEDIQHWLIYDFLWLTVAVL